MSRPSRHDEPMVETAVRLPLSLRDRLDEEADARGTSRNLILERAAVWLLKHLPPIEPVSATTKRVLEEGGTFYCLWEWQDGECPTHDRIHRCGLEDDHRGDPHACRCGSVMPS